MSLKSPNGEGTKNLKAIRFEYLLDETPVFSVPCVDSASSRNIHVASILSTRKGKPLLLDNEYFGYRQQTTSADKSKIFWICSQQNAYKCNARVHTDTNFRFLKASGMHNHEPTKHMLTAIKRKRKSQ